MKKLVLKRFMLKFVILLGIIILSGCEKEYEKPLENSGLDLLKESYLFTSLKSQATRKAVMLTITDLETGETTTLYDCSQPGRSCDVGETLPSNPHQSFRIRGVGRLEHQKRLLQLDETIDKLKRSGKIRVVSDQNHIAIFDVLSSELLFLSLYTENEVFLKDKPTPIFRAAKINTETNTLECKEPGSNCFVGYEETQLQQSFRKNPKLFLSVYGLHNSIGNANDKPSLFKGNFQLFQGKNYLKIVSEEAADEPFFILLDEF